MDDREIAKRAVDFQVRAKSYRMLDIPAYQRWSKRKLSEGVSDALIAHFDATAMDLLPEEVAMVDEAIFDDLLVELEADLGE